MEEVLGKLHARRILIAVLPLILAGSGQRSKKGSLCKQLLMHRGLV